MSVGLGQTFRSSILNYIFRGATSPAAATYYISLHTADPGDDGQTANEPVGNNYARVSVTAGTGAFNATTSADPSVLTNNGVITFNTASGAWGTITHFGLWTSSSGTTGYVGRGTTNSQSVISGNTPTFATGQLAMNITIVTSGSTTGMGRAFRAALYDHLFRAQTDPLPNGTYTSLFCSLHTADPGDTGASESSGGGYTRATFARVTSPAFGTATNGNPSYISNTNTAVAFPVATAPGYNSGTGANIWFAIWRVVSSGTGADYIMRGTMTSQVVVTGNTPSFAITGGSAPAGPGRLFAQLDQT